jgi:hypothetical protein
MAMECIHDFFFEYDGSDIEPNAVVVETTAMFVGKIIILQDLSDLSYLFECLLESDFEFETEAKDRETYIDEVINENKSYHSSQSIEQDDIMTDYFNWQRKRIENAGDDFEKLMEIINDYGTSIQVGDFCYFQEYVKSDDFESWFIEDIFYEDDNNFDEENFDMNSLFKSSEYKDRIASRINRFNEVY